MTASRQYLEAAWVSILRNETAVARDLLLESSSVRHRDWCLLGAKNPVLKRWLAMVLAIIVLPLLVIRVVFFGVSTLPDVFDMAKVANVLAWPACIVWYLQQRIEDSTLLLFNRHTLVRS